MRLYWQDFFDFCEVQKLPGAQGAPISTAYEIKGSNVLSESERVVFVDEDFQTDSSLHYAGNANPVIFLDDESKRLFEECTK